MSNSIIDCTLNIGNYNTAEEISGTKAIILAIKNIILSRPGNYPQTPSLGLDIEQYLGDFADSKTASTIKSKLDSQISKYVENASVTTDVGFKTAEIPGLGSVPVLYISISASSGDEVVYSTFLLYESGQELYVYNETY